MEENKVEELEKVEEPEKVEELTETKTEEVTTEPAPVENNPTPEKIEIVEHTSSKYDDIKPRTEMSEMSDVEKEEIKSKVLGTTPSPSPEPATQTETAQAPEKKDNGFVKTLVFILLLILVLAFFYIFLILPNM